MHLANANFAVVFLRVICNPASVRVLSVCELMAPLVLMVLC